MSFSRIITKNKFNCQLNNIILFTATGIEYLNATFDQRLYFSDKIIYLVAYFYAIFYFLFTFSYLNNRHHSNNLNELKRILHEHLFYCFYLPVAQNHSLKRTSQSITEMNIYAQ